MEYEAAPASESKSPRLKFPPSSAAAPPSMPSTATPQNANAHPSHVMDFTLSPPKLAMKGVNAMEACVKKLTRVASVNNSATLHNP